MQTTGTLEEINIDYKTGKPKISFLIDGRDKLSDIEQLKGLKLKIEAKKYIKKRTTNANNYFWKLLQELCEEEEIDTIEEYKKRVKELGIFRRFRIETENIKTFEKMWVAQGIAWFCEIADTTYIGSTEFKIINAYYGSSSFNSKQMSRVVIGKQYETCDNYEEFKRIVNLKKINVNTVEAGNKISIENGFCVGLCHAHHNTTGTSVHFNKEMDLELKRVYQKEYEKNHTREEFIKLIGKSYLD